MSWWMVVVANWLTWCRRRCQVSVLGPQLFLLYTAELFSIVENKLYGCADDSTFIAVVPSPAERVAVTESLNRDLKRVSVWCDLLGMKLNASKSKTIIVSRSCTVHRQLTPLTLDGTVLNKCHIGGDV